MPENKVPVGILAAIAIMVCCFGHLILLLLVTGTLASFLDSKTSGIIVFAILLAILAAYISIKRWRRTS